MEKGGAKEKKGKEKMRKSKQMALEKGRRRRRRRHWSRWGTPPTPDKDHTTTTTPPQLLKVKVGPFIKRLAFSSKLSHRQCDNYFGKYSFYNVNFGEKKACKYLIHFSP